MDFQQDVPLAPYTTLRIGGPARFFAHITSEAELLEAIDFARERRLRIFTLGGGSNLVVPDAGFAGLVLHTAFPPSIRQVSCEDAGKDLLFEVSAGTNWDALVLHLCELGLSGMECLAGIPGLVGGSPIQNIGAYGQEVSQTIASVRALDLQTLSFVEIPSRECGFAYRTSLFNSTARDRYIVTSARFRLSQQATPNLSYTDLAPLRGTNPSPLDVYHAVRRIRDRKGMLIDAANLDPASLGPHTRSAGSFFKNPIVPCAMLASIASALSIPEEAVPHWPAQDGSIKLPAAWLIERAGFSKGFALSPESPVAISSRHTLALINRSGSATCADLLQLRDHIASGVQSRFKVRLEQEPIFLG